MGEILPPTPRSHSINLSPSGTDFKDIAFKISPNGVPMNNFLNGLLGGRRKKLFVCWYVMIVVLCKGFNGHNVILKCGNIAVVREDGMGGYLLQRLTSPLMRLSYDSVLSRLVWNKKMSSSKFGI